jgi:hypothetical protein
MGVARSGWTTETEAVSLTGVPADVLRRGIDSGLFDGLACEVDGALWYALDVVPLVAWSEKLGDDVIAGYLTRDEAKSILWRRARQLRRRTGELRRRLAGRP